MPKDKITKKRHEKRQKDARQKKRNDEKTQAKR